MKIKCCPKLLIVFSILASGVRSAPLIDEVNAKILNQLFEGDIEGFDLNSSDKKLSKIPNGYSGLWQDGIVFYKINEENYNSDDIEAILEGMRMIEDGTRVNGQDCIRFYERESEDNYLNIFSGRGCYSKVGRLVKPTSQDVSLQAGGCTSPGIAAHEFLHALGFWHEQSRPDRDNFITIKWNNIDEDMKHNFNKYTTNIDTFELPYDYQSIMHYNPYSFAIDRSKPTIVAKKQGISFGQREKLSELDIQAIQKLYGCI